MELPPSPSAESGRIQMLAWSPALVSPAYISQSNYWVNVLLSRLRTSQERTELLV